MRSKSQIRQKDYRQSEKLRKSYKNYHNNVKRLGKNNKKSMINYWQLSKDWQSLRVEVNLCKLK